MRSHILETRVCYLHVLEITTTDKAVGSLSQQGQDIFTSLMSGLVLGHNHFPVHLVLGVGWVSVVGIVACYRPDGPRIDPGGGRDFPHLSRPALGLTQPPVESVRSLFPGGKMAGAWC